MSGRMIRKGDGHAHRPRVVCRRQVLSRDIEIVRGVHVSARFTRHVHRTFIVGIVEEGERSISSAGEEVRIAHGECFVLNPAQAHACHSSGPHTYTVVSIGPEIMANVFRRIAAADRHPFFPGIRLADVQLAGCLSQFRLDPRDSEDTAFHTSNINRLLTRLATCHAVPDCRSVPGQPEHLARAVARVCAFVAAHAEEKLSLAQLASVAYISPGHFQRTFVRMTGISAHDYLMQCRVRKARQMLERGAEPGDVALATGFFDQSHFSRVFRAAVGTTPGRYARWHFPCRNQAACSPLSVSACSSGA